MSEEGAEIGRATECARRSAFNAKWICENPEKEINLGSKKARINAAHEGSHTERRRKVSEVRIERGIGQ